MQRPTQLDDVGEQDIFGRYLKELGLVHVDLDRSRLFFDSERMDSDRKEHALGRLERRSEREDHNKPELEKANFLFSMLAKISYSN